MWKSRSGSGRLNREDPTAAGSTSLRVVCRSEAPLWIFSSFYRSVTHSIAHFLTQLLLWTVCPCWILAGIPGGTSPSAPDPCATSSYFRVLLLSSPSPFWAAISNSYSCGFKDVWRLNWLNSSSFLVNIDFKMKNYCLSKNVCPFLYSKLLYKWVKTLRPCSIHWQV